MSILRAVRATRAGLRALLRREDANRDLDDEMRHYLDESARDKVARGMTAVAASRAARVEFGGTAVVRERLWSARWESAAASIIQDLSYALRAMRSAPGFSLIAIATLSIGMAATTSVLTAANTVLRQAWNVPNASRVFTIVAARGGPGLSPAGARFLAARTAPSGSIIIMRCIQGANVGCDPQLDGIPAPVDLVGGNYFAALGVPLQLGRAFAADEDVVGDPHAVVVLSDAAWRARYGADPRIIGRQIRIDEIPFTVIGIAARGFSGTRTEPREAWIPLAAAVLLRPNRPEYVAQMTTPSANISDARVAIRLADGVTRAGAEGEIAGLVRVWEVQNSLDMRGARLIASTLFPNPSKQRTAAALFALLLVASLLVLALACANVGNLLLARAAARRREIGIRLALGAGRGRVVRQLLIESLLLAIASSAIGLAIAYRLPGRIMADTLGPLAWRFEPNGAVLAAALATTLLTCVAFGLAPALHATRGDVYAAVRHAGSAHAGSERLPLRAILLAAQVSISLILLVSAGLLIRGLAFGRDRDVGFRAGGVSVLSVRLPASYDSAALAAFSRQLAEQREAVGLPRYGVVADAPLSNGLQIGVRLPTETASRTHTEWRFDMSPGTLGVLGMPVVAGRDLTPGDDEGVLVNESLGRELWPGESALGKTLIDDQPRRVVGVVRDAVLYRLDRVEGAVFRPLRPGVAPVMLARGVTPTAVQALMAVAKQIDRHATVDVDSIAGGIDRQLGPARVVAVLASSLGAIALTLACVGVFGVFSFIVQQRTREIGIHAALGAPPGKILGLVLRDNLRPTAVGVALGLVGALGVAKVLQSQMYGANPFDAIAFGGSVAILGVASVVATLIPARRATNIDPLIALRND